MKSLKDIGMKSMVSSSVKGVRSESLLSSDVHTKDNRRVEKMKKMIGGQANQTAGNAKKSHIFQYGGVGVWAAALETKLVSERLEHRGMIHSRIPNSFLSLHPLMNIIE